MFLALFAVIALSLAAGVGLGYAIIFGILNAFDRSRQSVKGASAHALTTSAGND
jgi:predicted exporter